MKRQRAHAAVDVQVPAQDPAHHVQVVDAHTLLQQVVALLVVHLENVFTLAGETERMLEVGRVQTAHSYTGLQQTGIPQQVSMTMKLLVYFFRRIDSFLRANLYRLVIL